MGDGDQLALGALKSMSVRDLLTDLIEANQDVRSEVVADRIIETLRVVGWKIIRE